MKHFTASAIRSPSPSQPNNQWEKEFQHFVAKRRRNSDSNSTASDSSAKETPYEPTAADIDALLECDIFDDDDIADDLFVVVEGEEAKYDERRQRSVSYSNFRDVHATVAAQGGSYSGRRSESIGCRTMSTSALFTMPHTTRILLSNLKRSSSESIVMNAHRLDDRQADIMRQITMGWN